MKFTPAEKEYFAKVRAEDPSVDQLFKDVRLMMEKFNARIVHLTVRDQSWGRPMPEGEPYVPVPKALRPKAILKGTKQQQPTTVGQRRRAATKYKGE